MKMFIAFILSTMFISCCTQRPPYAGRQAIGYPNIVPTTVETDLLGNRFGETNVPTTTVRLPIEALGDAELVNRLSKLPVDQQPFWLLNWRALEQQRKNPQTYQPNNNDFLRN